jgi:hypothetical protein
MVNSVRAMVLGSIAIAALAPPACAEPPKADPNLISTGDSIHYAKYYMPYAILASVAYYPNSKLTPEENAKSAVDEVFTADSVQPVIDLYARKKPTSLKEIRTLAMEPEALGPWSYEFGDDGNGPCLKEPKGPNVYCNNHIPNLEHPPGPTFQVWAKKDESHPPGRPPPQQKESCNEVSIAFRGTQLDSDWSSNLRFASKVPVLSRWYPEVDNSYTWLQRNVDAIIDKIVGLPCYDPAKPPIIISLGHSLGGGLAQFAALANNPDRPHIEKVFAFESSPETGGDLAEFRAANSKKLEIDRVGQVGDASSVLQALQTYIDQYIKEEDLNRSEASQLLHSVAE